MYDLFYKLTAEPFRMSPDHHFCYEHKAYTKARAYMAYAYMRAEGFVMITGRPGTGKTTLIGELIESLADDNVTTANLVCTQLQADDLLKLVAYDFGVDQTVVEKGELLQHLGRQLKQWQREGRRALLIVDEAQDLSVSAMEELRLLTNIQQDGKPLLQIFLLGQPELRELILSPKLEQVHQRIVAASHLQALERDETEAYIRHRLEAVGWRGDPAISKSIFPLVYKFSEGIPRRINLIFSRLLLHGAVEQRHRIGVKDVREVIRELQDENLAAGKRFSELDFQIDDEWESVLEPAPEPATAATPPEPGGQAAPQQAPAGETPSQGTMTSQDPAAGRETAKEQETVKKPQATSARVEPVRLQEAPVRENLEPRRAIGSAEVVPMQSAARPRPVPLEPTARSAVTPRADPAAAKASGAAVPAPRKARAQENRTAGNATTGSTTAGKPARKDKSPEKPARHRRDPGVMADGALPVVLIFVVSVVLVTWAVVGFGVGS